ncbi:MAG: hypothetical protein JSW39_15825 [Desulfobacterales bacterium]|nr:MAG: hypothetical protein JSW39_15825 [Desulfobacterales bacterium]
MRKFQLFASFIILGLLTLGLMFAHASYRQRADLPAIESKRELVGRYELTDLCLFTDARYTRHPTMADVHTPFQDYPTSLEHFPSASILSLPPHLRPLARK